MTEIWTLAALWLGLALVATLISIWLRIATALSEIVVGTIAQLVIGALIGAAMLGTDQTWIKFLSGTGAILLTFLAGAELDPVVFRERWKEAGAIGVISFLVPFLGCTVAARYLLGWDPMASWLAGVAMSTTSVAVVYAVMLEFGFNATDYGKVVLAACFVTDLGTVLMLGPNLCAVHDKNANLRRSVCCNLDFLALDYRSVFSTLRRPPFRTGDKVSTAAFVRIGWACRLGRQRGCPSRLLDWDDPCGHRRQRSHFDPKIAHFVLWVSYTVLFHSGWFVCLCARFDRCTGSVSSDACGQAVYKSSGCLPCYPCFWLAPERRDVHHANDVDGTDLRDYFVAVRTVAWHHRSGPVFRTGRGSCWQRRCSDFNCQCFLSSAPPITQR